MKSELLTAVSQLSSEKGVSKELVLEALEAALVSAYKRNFNAPEEALTAEIDQSSSDVRIFHHPTVVESEPEGPDQVTLEEARKLDPSAQPGDALNIEVTPPNFNLGRIAAQTAKQVVVQKLREAERKMVYDEFAEREGEIVHGIVQRIEQGNVLVELGRADVVGVGAVVALHDPQLAARDPHVVGLRVVRRAHVGHRDAAVDHVR